MFLVLMLAATAMPAADVLTEQQERVEVEPAPGAPLLVRGGDYPRDAAANRETGRVLYGVDVDERGRPTACRVLNSSGIRSLDARTCQLVMARARFTPARGANGAPALGRYADVVRWELPSGAGGPNNNRVRFNLKLTMSPDGRIEKCSEEKASGRLQPNTSQNPQLLCPAIGPILERGLLHRVEQRRRDFVVSLFVEEPIR